MLQQESNHYGCKHWEARESFQRSKRLLRPWLWGSFHLLDGLSKAGQAVINAMLFYTKDIYVKLQGE